MPIKTCLWAAACLLAGLPAHAAVVATVSATYDRFLQDTVFTVSNLSGQQESVSFGTSLGPTTSSGPYVIAASDTGAYAFNALNGGLILDPQAEGVPDTTTYTVTVQLAGVTATSAPFSPLANATGAYVDFLGNTCAGFAGCAVAQSGTVATVSANIAVPEPASAALLAAGLLGLAVARRRA